MYIICILAMGTIYPQADLSAFEGLLNSNLVSYKVTSSPNSSETTYNTCDIMLYKLGKGYRNGV